MKKNLLSLSNVLGGKTFRSLDSQQIFRFIYTTNHKTGGFVPNIAARNFATKTPIKTPMDIEKNKKKIATDVVKNSAFKLTGAQVRDLTQTLIRLKDRELVRQEKRQTGKHLHDGVIKGLTKTIDLLKNLLQHGYNPGRYSYDEADFSYSRPVRTLTEAQREKNLDNLEIARATKERKANRARLNNDT